MNESETDIEFVSDMEWLHSHDREAALPPEKLIRLFALARRGAETAAEIERLKVELEQCQQTLYRQIGLTIEASEEATKASATEIERLRAALDKMKRSRDRYRQAWEAEKARAALKEDGDEK